ncbi:hypothetical protein [Deinococcus navajonensis]|uniref:DUF2946 domain-containing protein n=1 Tax=Deinococcus navajonensis TaxID=309884 RepID=A0ABV8XLC9_9DEIO
MRARPALKAQFRWLLAMLCLLGSLVYTVRTIEPRPFSPMGHHGAHPAGHDGRAQAQESASHWLAHPQPAEGHSAHCLFCVTAAFGLVPLPPPVPLPLVHRKDRYTRSRHKVALALVRHADPRAPPRVWDRSS